MKEKPASGGEGFIHFEVDNSISDFFSGNDHFSNTISLLGSQQTERIPEHDRNASIKIVFTVLRRSQSPVGNGKRHYRPYFQRYLDADNDLCHKLCKINFCGVDNTAYIVNCRRCYVYYSYRRQRSERQQGCC